jgi:hypothetical protein
LGVLLDAGEAGLIDPPQVYRRLIEETTSAHRRLWKVTSSAGSFDSRLAD